MKPAVKILFASAPPELIPSAVERMRTILPELPLEVISEFPVAGEKWTPFLVGRSVWENHKRFQAKFRDRHVRLSAVMLHPTNSHWQMRLAGFLLSPRYFLAMNENGGNFMLRPRSLGNIARHLWWRLRSFVVFQANPGGTVYTHLWRLAHPHALVRPWHALRARLAGRAASWRRRLQQKQAQTWTPQPNLALPHGISVVIPSRSGKVLLQELLPECVRQIKELGGEVIVSDNGSDDGTAAWLKKEYPEVVVSSATQPLSFARAVNAGIQCARFSHICLLNNDMVIERDFFRELQDAFRRVPDLFCSTAQIFFPSGARREETGKAVMPPRNERLPMDFPLRCDEPHECEDLSYVLYGSGGCSLYDTEKLRALGGVNEAYEPAYVEDLDLGFRGWQRGWPSVFRAGARVLHLHRSTTSKFYSEDELAAVLEENYLRFVAGTVQSPSVFRELWMNAVDRLNRKAALEEPSPSAQGALRNAWRIAGEAIAATEPRLDESEILRLGSGAVSVFPGRPASGKPIVLIASPYLPFPLSHGGAVRMFNLMKRAAADFDQVLVSFCDERPSVARELLDICVEVVTVRRPGTHVLPASERPDVVEEFDSPVYRAAVRQTMRKWRAGIAQLEFTQMAQYAEDCAPARTLLVEHDITLDLYRQLLAQAPDDWELPRQLEKWSRFEQNAWRTVDRVITMSEKDRRLAGEKAVTIANGVDVDRFRPSGKLPEDGRILFVGSLAHLPNVLALEFFLREAWPRLEAQGARLHVIAGLRHEFYLERHREKAQLDLARPGIEVEGFVADVRPAYERAAVVIAPLLASAGTNIKIMEAMAMGKAIVSTTSGVNGIDVEDGHEVVIANDGDAMARAIEALMRSPESRMRLEAQAREAAVRRFDWDRIAREQRAVYAELLALPSLRAKTA